MGGEAQPAVTPPRRREAPVYICASLAPGAAVCVQEAPAVLVEPSGGGGVIVLGDFCRLPSGASLAAALASLDGVYLSSSEDEFYNRVLEELERFRLEENQKKVLLFPPLTSRLRYLTHRITETFNSLSSFSVGEGWKRRTVVCHLNVRLPDQETDADNVSNMCQSNSRHQKRYRAARDPEFAARETRPHVSPLNRESQRGQGRKRFNRRPDQALYVPCRRSQKRDAGEQVSELRVAMEPVAAAAAGKEEICLQDKTEEAAAGSMDNPRDGQDSPRSSSDVTARDVEAQLCHPSPETGEACSEADSSSVPGKGTETAASADGPGTPEPGNPRENCAAAGEPERSKEGLLDAGALEAPAAGEEENSTDGDCTDQLLKEIAARLTEQDISIEKPQVDYSIYGDSAESEDKFGHIIEIFDFTPTLRTEDLMEAFSDFQAEGFRLQWVDNTHALGIFSSQTAEFFQPTKWRIPTDPSVAKRLVTRALGLQNQKEPKSE
ncbi:R3H and coiled-coil domain-containing protein 1 isoform X2 [Rhinatrema bivittatum]|uniref:R3H and coiled-coil domain-containing protein 1 isoform X2 n=1 Tax=Rhinatrema bivittatum TaxID=194408 RepID=UPI001126DAAE|nr:R3H and coiled-coil domain-containing protein 1 isoform X2 [Rhinatrema bivittatum]